MFVCASLRDKAYVTLAVDRHAIAVDFYLFARRVRANNLYVPAERNFSPEFFASLDVFMLDSYPTFLVGNFNCVLDPMRDVQ